MASQVVSPAQRTLQIVLYLRVSTEEQAKNGMSLADQRREGEKKARELAADLGADYQLYVFEDHHGGDILDRPVLEEMRIFVRQTRPDYFVCFDPNRFSRSLKLQLILADEIEDMGTRIIFVMQDYDPDDMMSRAFFQFRGLMSELDKAKILDQTMRGRRQKLRAGKLAHGVMAFGYDFARNQSELVINEAEARWVRLIFQWAREGLGPDRIAQRLIESSVPTKRGGQWRRCVVAKMLANTTYIGYLVANRKDTRGHAAQSRLPKERRKIKLSAKIRDPSEWVRISVPAIITEAEFAEVQSIRAGFKRKAQIGVGLLSGLCVCGVCGDRMTYQPSPRGYYLRCVNRYPRERGSRRPAEACRLPHIPAAPVEAYVWELIEEWLTKPEHLETYILERRNLDVTEEPTRAVEEELTGVQESLKQKKDEQSRILYIVAKGLVHPEVSEPQLAALNDDITLLLRRESALKARLTALRKTSTVDVDALRTRIHQVREAISAKANEVRARMDGLDGPHRQQLVRRMLAGIEVRADGSCALTPVGVN